jgi:hypothetical protein
MSVLASPERWHQVKLALGEVLERDAAHREAFLLELRSSDPDLARDVQSLMGWYDASDGLLLSVPPAAMEAADTLAAGCRLGPYEVLELLGRGGMGAVYRARDVRLGRVVAVKVLSDATEGGASLLRFEREARTFASLSHPNILAIFDYGREGETAYAVTELLQGESLRSRLRRGPLPLADALGLARQVANGLAAAHDNGIVHRDLKPENVFLCADGTAKILDFGLAKPALPLASAATGLTRVGVLMGTVGYMAPEQVRGEEVDARADVFAFGVLLHEVLAGRRPFDRDTPAETLAAVLRDAPRLDAAAIPPPLARLLDRCLAKDPARRFTNARDLLTALQSTAALRWSRQRRLTRRGAIAAGLLLVLASAASVLRESSLPLRPADLTIAVGENPMGMAFEGDNVWVANRGSNSVTRIRAGDGRTTGTFPIGESPVDVAWDGASVWVANHKWLAEGHSTLVRLDPAEGRVLATHRLPGQPMQLVVDRDVLWVTETWPTYTLRKLRLPDGAELGAFSAGGTPRLVATDGESVWASNGGLGSVSRIRADDGRVLLSRAIGGVPVSLERLGPEIWTHDQLGTLFRLRAEDLEIVDRLAVGLAAFTVSDRWIFVGEPGRIVQRRRADGAVLAAWAAGPNPFSLRFDGTNLWAADVDAGTVTLIRGESLAAGDRVP